MTTAEEASTMKAQVGDRLLPGDNPDHVGLIIGLREADGSPPYVVKWLDTGHIALVFPGQYARIMHASDPGRGSTGMAKTESQAPYSGRP